MKALHYRGLARMIHERFCCNRLPVRVRTQTGRSAALAREASAGAWIDSLFHRIIDSMVQWINRQSPLERRFTRNALPGGVATNRHESCGRMVLAGMCCAALFCPCLIVPAHSASSPQTASSSGLTKRWVQFELNQAESMGNPQTGKPVTLTIFLGGVTAGMTPVVATCQSIMFQAQTITLEPDEESMALKGTVTLEPILMSRTSVPPRAARVQVTFARARQDKLERFMRRVVYVTMDRLEPADESSELPPVRPEESQSDDVILDEVQPDVEPVSTGALAEEDLVPFASPGEGKAYWQYVSHLISRSWARQVRGIRHAPRSETVKVHFKMFPSGRAQLIEIEKGSGTREIDEAGIYAVVNAQPFLPFSNELGEDTVDVHVRMRTGSRGRSREVQSVGSLSIGKSGTSGQPSKK